MDYIQRSAVTQTARKSKAEGKDAYVQLIHFALQQKRTAHRKAAILQQQVLQNPLLTFKYPVCSCCLVTKQCPPLLRPCRRQPTRLLRPWDFPGRKTGVGCHFLLQETFPTQGSNLRPLRWQVDALPAGKLQVHNRSLLIAEAKLSVRSPVRRHPVARSVCALADISRFPRPSAPATTTPLPVSQSRPCKTPRVGEGTQGFLLSVWLISLSIISSSSHIVKGGIPFFSVAERCFLTYIYHSLLVHSSADGISVLSTFLRDSVTEKELTQSDKEFEQQGASESALTPQRKYISSNCIAPVDPVRAAPGL